MITVPEEFEITQWEDIVSKFTKTFNGLGTVLHNEKIASFTSRAPDVETGIAIYSDGQFSASMPLHGIDSIVKKVTFNHESITLTGDSIEYTYRIPPQILKRRGE